MLLFWVCNLHNIFFCEDSKEKIKFFLTLKQVFIPRKSCCKNGQWPTLNMQLWCFLFSVMTMSNSEMLRSDLELVFFFTSSEILG